MHEPGLTLGDRMRDVSEPADGPDGNGKHPFLVRLGERVRTRRNGRGMTRKELAAAAGVSERHLGNLELGVGNASVLILLQGLAEVLKCIKTLQTGVDYRTHAEAGELT